MIILHEYFLLASEAGGSEYGTHARILLPDFLSTIFSIILKLVRVQIFVKTENFGDLTKNKTF